MKYHLKLFFITNGLLLVAFNIAFGQTNLVPNPSFETYTSCPNNLDQVIRCQGWSPFRTTPDYFNICAPIGNSIKPPYSYAGFQQPQDGNAYCGLITYDNSGQPNYREVIGSQLINSLNIGTKYYFSFYVSFGGAQVYQFATNKIGLRFSTIPYSVSNPIPINNFAHYFCPTKITDSLNWTRLKGSFVADSIYKYIAIGNFFNDSNTDTLSTGQFNQESYYYVDNVCLSTDSTLAYTTFVQTFINSQNISIYPNPCNNLLHVKSDGSLKEIEVLNIMGDVQMKSNNLSEQPEYTIDVSSLSNGIYLLKVRTQNQFIQKQIIILK